MIVLLYPVFIQVGGCYPSALVQPETSTKTHVSACVCSSPEALWLESESSASFQWLTVCKHWDSTCDIAVQGERLDVSDAAAESKKLNRQKPCSNMRYTVNVSEFGFY